MSKAQRAIIPEKVLENSPEILPEGKKANHLPKQSEQQQPMRLVDDVINARMNALNKTVGAVGVLFDELLVELVKLSKENEELKKRCQ